MISLSLNGSAKSQPIENLLNFSRFYWPFDRLGDSYCGEHVVLLSNTAVFHHHWIRAQVHLLRFGIHRSLTFRGRVGAAEARRWEAVVQRHSDRTASAVGHPRVVGGGDAQVDEFQLGAVEGGNVEVHGSSK